MTATQGKACEPLENSDYLAVALAHERRNADTWSTMQGVARTLAGGDASAAGPLHDILQENGLDELAQHFWPDPAPHPWKDAGYDHQRCPALRLILGFPDHLGLEIRHCLRDAWVEYIFPRLVELGYCSDRIDPTPTSEQHLRELIESGIDPNRMGTTPEERYEKVRNFLCFRADLNGDLAALTPTQIEQALQGESARRNETAERRSRSFRDPDPPRSAKNEERVQRMARRAIGSPRGTCRIKVVQGSSHPPERFGYGRKARLRVGSYWLRAAEQFTEDTPVPYISQRAKEMEEGIGAKTESQDSDSQESAMQEDHSMTAPIDSRKQTPLSPSSNIVARQETEETSTPTSQEDNAMSTAEGLTARNERILELAIEDIIADPQLQPRESMCEATIDEYQRAVNDGELFPPGVVFQEGEGRYWLADGFHRREARRRAGKKTLLVEVRQGTRRDALLYAAGTNGKRQHGLNRKDTDIRRQVCILLRDSEWREWSDREIARHCDTTHPTVAKYRRELEHEDASPSSLESVTSQDAPPLERVEEPSPTPETPKTRTYRTRHGTTAKMRVDNIGKKKKAEPEPAAPEPPAADPRQGELSFVEGGTHSTPTPYPDVPPVAETSQEEVEDVIWTDEPSPPRPVSLPRELVAAVQEAATRFVALAGSLDDNTGTKEDLDAMQAFESVCDTGSQLVEAIWTRRMGLPDFSKPYNPFSKMKDGIEALLNARARVRP